MSYNKKTILGVVGAVLILLGSIFYLLQYGFVIIRFPWQYSQIIALQQRKDFQRKSFAISYYKHSKWHTEQTMVLWSDTDLVESIRYLVNCWISIVQDAELVSHALILRHAAFTSVGNEVLLSFNNNLFNSQWSIEQKMMLLESILKTLKSAGIQANFVSFLANDDYMIDSHIDFSKSLPIDGFLQNF